MRRLLLLLALAAASPLHSQNKGQPGKFDFYLLNVVPAAEFCKIKDVGPDCRTPVGPMALHGLWPQNFNGTYPVFCDDRKGVRHPERYMALISDLILLDHEWKKHGTCTTLGAEQFFAAARKARNQFDLPPDLLHPQPGATMKTADVVSLLQGVNPRFPPGSVVVWCSEGRLTSVSACFSKDLKPIACQGLKSCADDVIVLAPNR